MSAASVTAPQRGRGRGKFIPRGRGRGRGKTTPANIPINPNQVRTTYFSPPPSPTLPEQREMDEGGGGDQKPHPAANNGEKKFLYRLYMAIIDEDYETFDGIASKVKNKQREVW